ncbi:MAG TPA: helix-turn-helix domain-containing protein [Pilimelia sp.]|nr:helix-turn-helix domain-containing protein [Pilimelia sp.]
MSDAADIRFCISPLWETVRSVCALADPGGYVTQLPWIRRAKLLLDDRHVAPHLRLLSCVSRPDGWLPDFLTPAPPGPLTQVEDELAMVRATPPATVIADLIEITRRSPLPPPVAAGLDNPDALLERLVEAARVWHRAAIAPDWPRMQALLEADIAHRARDLAEGGVRRLFNRLHPSMRWHGDRIINQDPWDDELDLRGRGGLPLMPSLFVRKIFWNARHESPPMAIYPARAVAALWQGGTPGHRALARILGATRAQLLAVLRVPATTTELARRLGLSPAAVSQHLTALHAAGLVGRSQHGRNVLYLTTETGRALLRAAGGARPGSARPTTVEPETSGPEAPGMPDPADP